MYNRYVDFDLSSGNTVQKGAPKLSAMGGGGSLSLGLPFFTAVDEMALHSLKAADSLPVRNQFDTVQPSATGSIETQIKANMDQEGGRGMGEEAPAFSWAKNAPKSSKQIYFGHYAHPGDDFSDTKFNPPTTFGVDERTGLQQYASANVKMDTSGAPDKFFNLTHKTNPTADPTTASTAVSDFLRKTTMATYSANGRNTAQADGSIGHPFPLDLSQLGPDAVNLPGSQFVFPHELDEFRQSNPALHVGVPSSGNLDMMSHEEGRPDYFLDFDGQLQ